MSEMIPLWQQNEGRRLFQTCLKYGATPGQVHEFLVQQLEKAKVVDSNLRDEEKCAECSAKLSLEEQQVGICRVCLSSDDEEDFLSGVTCNPDAPEECESCQ